jgi:hypothetical protein
MSAELGTGTAAGAAEVDSAIEALGLRDGAAVKYSGTAQKDGARRTVAEC